MSSSPGGSYAKEVAGDTGVQQFLERLGAGTLDRLHHTGLTPATIFPLLHESEFSVFFGADLVFYSVPAV